MRIQIKLLSNTDKCYRCSFLGIDVPPEYSQISVWFDSFLSFFPRCCWQTPVMIAVFDELYFPQSFLHLQRVLTVQLLMSCQLPNTLHPVVNKKINKIKIKSTRSLAISGCGVAVLIFLGSNGGLYVFWWASGVSLTSMALCCGGGVGIRSLCVRAFDCLLRYKASICIF